MWEQSCAHNQLSKFPSTTIRNTPKVPELPAKDVEAGAYPQGVEGGELQRKSRMEGRAVIPKAKNPTTVSQLAPSKLP